MPLQDLSGNDQQPVSKRGGNHHLPAHQVKIDRPPIADVFTPVVGHIEIQRAVAIDVRQGEGDTSETGSRPCLRRAIDLGNAGQEGKQ